MGDRGNIVVKERGQPPVYLYTHWRGSELKAILRRALAKHWRWDNAPYLARIIFCEMVKGQEDDETGFGISTYPPDEGTLFTVDISAQTVNDESFETFIA